MGHVTYMEYLDEVPPCCEVCGTTDDEAGGQWCGSCGSCSEHCEGYDTCPNWEESEVFELPGADAGF